MADEAPQAAQAVAGLSQIRSLALSLPLLRACLHPYVYLVVRRTACNFFLRAALRLRAATTKSGFISLVSRYLSGDEEHIEWGKIHTPTDEVVVPYDTLEAPPEDLAATKALLDKLPCSSSTAAWGQPWDAQAQSRSSSLKRSLNKKYGSNVPLLLMNSFNTHEDTLKIVEKYTNSSIRSTHSTRASILVSWPTSSCHSLPRGRLTRMAEILNHLIHKQNEYCMEVTPKTLAAVNGGTLISSEGRVQVDEFKSIEKFKIFNTNNLPSSAFIEADALKMEIIQTLSLICTPWLMASVTAIQLEQTHQIPQLKLGPEFKKGKVTITAKPGVKLEIPDGKVIENKDINGPEDL
ncbi:hypothetical protein ZWY2020_015750 [Hordeum vulgare]|nr:hypothetical protein ZWY2020_015750 [Hordeum vulgare]